MKKVLLLATAFMFTVAAFAQPKPDDVIKVNTETHDFGKIRQNEPVTFIFEVKNISDKPVVVESTSASCGCTTPEKPTEPIMPGTVGKIKVVYNAAAVAPFTKDVYIKLAGIEAQKIVHITGEVLSTEAYDAWKKEKKGNEPQATTTKEKTTPATTLKPVSAAADAPKPKLTKD